MTAPSHPEPITHQILFALQETTIHGLSSLLTSDQTPVPSVMRQQTRKRIHPEY
jgi:hypothetical protein